MKKDFRSNEILHLWISLVNNSHTCHLKSVGSLIQHALLDQLKFSQFNPALTQIGVYLYRLKDISISEWPPNNFSQFSILAIQYSKTEFYIGNETLRNFNFSKVLNLIPNDQHSGTFFNSFRAIDFTSSVKCQKDPICAYVFTNSTLFSSSLLGQLDWDIPLRTSCYFWYENSHLVPGHN
jgi:hypothetical protein